MSRARQDPIPSPPPILALPSHLQDVVNSIDVQFELENLRRNSNRTRQCLPASKASIDAMAQVAVTEEGIECAICLEVLEIGSEAKQMPKCDHRFHSACIETWLLGHVNSCPLCRSTMPSVQQEDETAGGNNNRQFANRYIYSREQLLSMRSSGGSS